MATCTLGIGRVAYAATFDAERDLEAIRQHGLKVESQLGNLWDTLLGMVIAIIVAIGLAVLAMIFLAPWGSDDQGVEVIAQPVHHDDERRVVRELGEAVDGGPVQVQEVAVRRLQVAERGVQAGRGVLSVAAGLILAELVKANNLQATPEQVKAQVDDFARAYLELAEF